MRRWFDRLASQQAPIYFIKVAHLLLLIDQPAQAKNFCFLDISEEIINYVLSCLVDRPGIEPKTSVSVADALSTRPLIGFN